ncbi:phospholipid carrier-dependent glycosyltransferase [Candidatus Dojkabacteria bacterium]|nr:phospholipid carrier-dependent glycosyltransferase [Candidatus Dojkabacteria bacterium]
MRAFFKKHDNIISLIFVIVLALVLRMFVLQTFEFWFDEAYTGLLVDKPWNQFFSVLREDVHPPLYYVLLKSWVTLFGNSVLTLRSFSVIFGVLTIPLVYIFVKKIKNVSHNTALLVSFIFSINPFFIEYSVEARTYSLLGFLMIAAATSFLFAMNKKKLELNRYWISFSLLISLVFLTHYLASFGILCFGLFFLYVYRKQVLKAVNFKFLFGVSLVPLLAFIYWIPKLLYQLNKTGGNLGWIPEANFMDIPNTLYIFLFGAKAHTYGLPPARQSLLGQDLLTFILFVSTITLLTYLSIKLKKFFSKGLILNLGLAFIPLILVVIISKFGIHMYVERYLLPYGIFYIIFLFLSLSLVNRKILYGFIICYAIISSHIFITSYTTKQTEFNDLIRYLKDNNEHELIVSTSPLDFNVIKYYLSSNNKLYLLDDSENQDYASWSIIEVDDLITSKEAESNNTIYVSPCHEVMENFKVLEEINAQFCIVKAS